MENISGDDDSAEKPDSQDEERKEDIDRRIAQSLEAEIRRLAEGFCYELPVNLKEVRLQNEALNLRMTLPLRNPPPPYDSEDRLSSRKDISEIRKGFAMFVRTEPQLAKRLSNFFFTEFHDFLRRYTKTYRFSETIQSKIHNSESRRLAGRPHLSIPSHDRSAVRKKGREIRNGALEVQTQIQSWKKGGEQLDDPTIRKLLKLHFDAEQYPWLRFALRNRTGIPSKRSYEKQNRRDQGNCNLGEPERWSIPDVAALWTQIWFESEFGQRYDLREIRKLLSDNKSR
jgi:hypothetical protein